MKMNERKKTLTGLLTIISVIFMTVIPSVPIKAEDGVNSTGNILLENGDMALYASDINYLETEKNMLFSELPVLPDSLNFDGSRCSNIKSKGVVDYAGGKVVIDTSDFMYLANEIDELEAAYKMNTVAALNYMGTYYMEDGSVTHDKSKESLPVEYAVNLSFEEIYMGVLQSQSVENLATTEEITGASADNLSTGTAAWLDGELVVGNGADNDASYKKGYSDGRTQGQNDVKADPGAYGIQTGIDPEYFELHTYKSVFNTGITDVTPQRTVTFYITVQLYVTYNSFHGANGCRLLIRRDGNGIASASASDDGYDPSTSTEIQWNHTFAIACTQGERLEVVFEHGGGDASWIAGIY